MKNLLALILFAGGLAGWYFYNQYQKMQKELANARKNLEAYESTLAERQTEFQTLVAALEMKKKVEFRKAEIAAMKTKADQARAETQNLRREHAAAVAEIRKKFIGQVFPELVLANGRKLVNVRVTKVDETGVAVTSASGVTKLRPVELSPEMRSMFYF